MFLLSLSSIKIAFDPKANMTSVKTATVHPLVLLNCVDHYNRVAKNTSKRVVGVLLGKNVNGDVDITK